LPTSTSLDNLRTSQSYIIYNNYYFDVYVVNIYYFNIKYTNKISHYYEFTPNIFLSNLESKILIQKYRDYNSF